MGRGRDYKVNPDEYIGRRFGALTIIGYVDKVENGVRFRVECDCGTTKTVYLKNLSKTKSCGCARFQHGHCPADSRPSPTYESWRGMFDRCTNLNATGYQHYGGRGIKICDRWRSFINFLADMGERPEGLSIDRINNEGDYEPKNCKWSTPKEQANNTRRSIKISRTYR